MSHRARSVTIQATVVLLALLVGALIGRFQFPLAGGSVPDARPGEMSSEQTLPNRHQEYRLIASRAQEGGGDCMLYLVGTGSMTAPSPRVELRATRGCDETVEGEFYAAVSVSNGVLTLPSGADVEAVYQPSIFHESRWGAENLYCLQWARSDRRERFFAQDHSGVEADSDVAVIAVFEIRLLADPQAARVQLTGRVESDLRAIDDEGFLFGSGSCLDIPDAALELSPR